MSCEIEIKMNEQSLYGEIFLLTCLETLEKENHCKFQKSHCALQPWPETCNGLKTIHAIVAESRTEFYFVQTLQAQKVARRVAKRGMLYCATFLGTSFQHKLQRKLHRVTPAAVFSSTFGNDCRDF